MSKTLGGMMMAAMLVVAITGCEKKVKIQAVEPAAKQIQGVQRLAVLDLAHESDPEVGRNVANVIVAEINETGAFEVMERSAVARVLAEQDFMAAGSDASQASRIGKLLGVDGVVVGEVISFTGTNRQGAVGANLRLVDVHSAKVVFSDTITVGYKELLTSRCKSTAMNQLSQQMAKVFVSQIAPHYVTREKYLLTDGGDASQANDRGIKFAGNSLWDKALEQFEQARTIDSNSAAVLNNLAICHEHFGDLDQAREAYEVAVVLDPDDERIQKNLAGLRGTFREHEQTAKAALEQFRANAGDLNTIPTNHNDVVDTLSSR